ncbi:Vanillin dehydrogenase [Cytospora mali]|uniref:Vanillin dehydrogenase n=1 Tax=Cytospora mali TaxID=578113 RepID=A0A194UZL6_CYTMA|nr:Vanillin dehydrogenase [Valsa mali var. pyri (nom. inval.)]
MASNNTNTNTKGATVPFIIGGKEIVSPNTFDVINPALGKAIHKCSSATEADATAAVDAAAKALPAWKAMVPTKRREIFLKAAELLETRREELVTTMVEELGVPRMWADFNITTAKSFTVDVAGRIVTIEGNLPTPQDPNTGAMVVKEPFGVVLAIAPWNAPYILGTRSVIFPMAAGNTVVFKVSELSPKTMWGICSVFADAGLPDGVLNMIAHTPANAAAITGQLIANEHIKKINFTGSTTVGRIIGRLAGENLKPVLLELGGKAPAIVWEDANLDLAADQCALGAFLNSGQVCMSTEKVIVHKAVVAEFEKKFLASINKFFPASGEAPLLINQPAVEKVKRLLRDAKDKGATLLNGDFEARESAPTRIRPIVVKGVTEKMDLYKTESFGPTVALYEVDTEEEALRLANDSDYGLTSAVFTEDLRRGLRFAKGIETGACHINSMSIHDESALPHGGAKGSGYGRFCAFGLEEWVRTKTITYQW